VLIWLKGHLFCAASQTLMWTWWTDNTSYQSHKSLSNASPTKKYWVSLIKKFNAKCVWWQHVTPSKTNSNVPCCSQEMTQESHSLNSDTQTLCGDSCHLSDVIQTFWSFHCRVFWLQHHVKTVHMPTISEELAACL